MLRMEIDRLGYSCWQQWTLWWTSRSKFFRFFLLFFFFGILLFSCTVNWWNTIQIMRSSRWTDLYALHWAQHRNLNMNRSIALPILSRVFFFYPRHCEQCNGYEFVGLKWSLYAFIHCSFSVNCIAIQIRINSPISIFLVCLFSTHRSGNRRFQLIDQNAVESSSRFVRFRCKHERKMKNSNEPIQILLQSIDSTFCFSPFFFSISFFIASTNRF